MRLITKGKKPDAIDPCFLYVIGLRDASGPLPHSKVGIAQNIDNRMSSLSTAQPFEVFCQMRHPYANRLVARGAEANVHVALSHLRGRGEWFNGFPADIEVMVRDICGQVDPKMLRFFRAVHGIADDASALAQY